MIIKNQALFEAKQLSVFGKGELFAQIQPLLDKEEIKILNVFDDTLPGVEYKIEKYVHQEDALFDLLYCVGYKDMYARFRRYKEIKEMGFNIVSFIADNAILSDKASIGNGTMINQGVIIDNFVNIGECCFVNIGAMISHHTVIQDNTFIAPGANIAGYVMVGEGAFIGANATIIDKVKIGEYSVIAAGAVVIADVSPYSLVAGNPAVIKRTDRLDGVSK